MIDGLGSIIGREMPGSYIQYDAPCLADALALAGKLRLEGRYRYFRGQRDASWEVRSTFARADAALREQAISDLSEFCAFATSAPELLPYLQDEDSIIATAQHHGLAETTFIDFSHEPEIAGWFASHDGVEGQQGAIFMVDRRAEEMLTAFGAPDGLFRFLEPDVPNLWRLQAQRGLFLDARTDVGTVWPLDRIFFPHNGSGSGIEARRIYPNQKSALEQAIDQYITEQARRAGFRSLVGDGSNIAWFEIIENDPPSPHAPAFDGEWVRGPDERWTEMDIDSSPPRLRADEILNDQAGLGTLIERRRRCAQLVVLDKADGDEPQLLLDRLWQGCRPHAYSSGQIARTVVATISTYRALPKGGFYRGDELESAAAALLDRPVEIAMAISGGSSTRAFVSSGRLWAALRHDAKARLGFETRPQDPDALQDGLQADYARPWQNFDEHAMLELFVDEIIPWQIATLRDPVAFSPTQVLTLGRP